MSHKSIPYALMTTCQPPLHPPQVSSGQRALIKAARSGQLELIRLLVADYGVSPLRVLDGTTMVHEAIAALGPKATNTVEELLRPSTLQVLEWMWMSTPWCMLAVNTHNHCASDLEH